MRAKEYIAANESSMKFPVEIEQIIGDLLPLRASKQQTVDYYNRKLIADIRRQGICSEKTCTTRTMRCSSGSRSRFR